MKIFLDDIIFSLQSIGGISVYWKEILTRINNSKDVSVDFNLIKSNKPQSVLQSDLNWDKTVLLDSSLPLLLLRSLPLIVKLPSKSLFHSSYLRVTFQKDICNIVTLHDFATELGLVKGVKSFFKKKLQSIAIKQADGIICVSESTRLKLIELFSISPSKIITIHHGCSELFYPISNFKVENKIVYVGARNDYKNFSTLVKIMEKLPNYNLVIVGGGRLNKLEKEQLKGLMPNRIEHFLDITTTELNQIYNTSFCLIYPSYYEGFGMPVIEAMKAGCPVITTKTDALAEVSGDASFSINDPFNVNEYLEGIKFLENENERKEMINRGLNHSRKYDWEIHFNKTVLFYKQIYNEKFKLLKD